VEATSTAAATTGSAFRYDDSQYVFNWSTKGLAPGTYRVEADLGGGVTHAVQISLKQHPQQHREDTASNCGGRTQVEARGHAGGARVSPIRQSRNRCPIVAPVEGMALQAVLAAQDVAACISYSWFSVRWTSAQVDVFSGLRAQCPRQNKGNEYGSGNRQVVQR
jgi:hypothetical protein